MTKGSQLPSLSLWGKPAMRRFRNDLDGLFDDFFRYFLNEDKVTVRMFDDMQSDTSFPKINVSETEDHYSVDIAIAGFSKEDVKLELKDGILNICAEKKEKSEEEGKTYLRKEISSRAFCRNVRFPSDINADKAVAEYKDGIINFKVDKIKEKDESCGVNVEIK
jgi:HSP20 family protein